MTVIMREVLSPRPAFPFALSVSAALLSACAAPGGSGGAVSPTGELAPAARIATGTPAVRAHLLLQPGEYDPSDPQRITGAYARADRLAVPTALAPQNKYVMFEGPTLENDVIAFRFYADARHRADVYGKRVPDLVLDTVGWDYHEVRDWGADVLKVGESLGIGAPAILHEGALRPLSEADVKTIHVVRTGGDTARVRFRWRGLRVGDARVDVEQDWWTVPGVYWAQVDLRVTGGEWPAGARWATGIVRHDAAGAPATGATAAGCAYVATWGPQSDQGDDLGLGVVALAPAESVGLPGGGPVAERSHVLAFGGGAPGEGVSYRMVAGWGRGHAGLRDAGAFAEVVTGACE